MFIMLHFSMNLSILSVISYILGLTNLYMHWQFLILATKTCWVNCLYAKILLVDVHGILDYQTIILGYVFWWNLEEVLNQVLEFKSKIFCPIFFYYYSVILSSWIFVCLFVFFSRDVIATHLLVLCFAKQKKKILL